MSKSYEYNLVGVLLTNGILVRRGASWASLKCYKASTICPPIDKSHLGWMSTTVTVQNPSCQGECVMFGEPIYNEDGTAELTICDDKTLQFKKLFDMRGVSDIEKISKFTEDELIEDLKNVEGLTFNTQKTNE